MAFGGKVYVAPLVLFFRRRLGLIAVALVWLLFYVRGEFPNESYQNGGVYLEVLLFNVACAIACVLIIITNMTKGKFSNSDNSVVVLVLLLARFLFSSSYVDADLRVKAFAFSLHQNSCKSTDSAYLNSIGFKYCYSWVNYPEARFIVTSPTVPLTSVNLTKNTADWPSSLIVELEKQKNKKNLLAMCGYRDVNRSFGDVYFVRVFCQ